MHIDKNVYTNAVNAILSNPNLTFNEMRPLLYFLAYALFGEYTFTYNNFLFLYPYDRTKLQTTINFLVETGYMRKIYQLWSDNYYYLFFPEPRFDLPAVTECADEGDEIMFGCEIFKEYAKKYGAPYRPDEENAK